MSSPIGGGGRGGDAQLSFPVARWKRETSHLSGSQLQTHTILSLATNTKTVVVVINVRVSALTVFLNCFRSILNFFFFLKQISSDLWTISYLFTSDWNLLLICANCKCFGTCVQTISTIVCSLACWSKLTSRFSLKLSNSSQILNHFSSCKPSHSKRYIQLWKMCIHACIFHKYLTLRLFVMSAKLANYP